MGKKLELSQTKLSSCQLKPSNDSRPAGRRSTVDLTGTPRDGSYELEARSVQQSRPMRVLECAVWGLQTAACRSNRFGRSRKCTVVRSLLHTPSFVRPSIVRGCSTTRATPAACGKHRTDTNDHTVGPRAPVSTLAQGSHCDSAPSRSCLPLPTHPLLCARCTGGEKVLPSLCSSLPPGLTRLSALRCALLCCGSGSPRSIDRPLHRIIAFS